jgi:iron-sulfur cluster assembly protein
MNYVNDTIEDEKKTKLDDVVKHDNGVNVYVDPAALFNIVGTVMDYEISEISEEFTFKNPNARGECGCGESFNVD